MLISFHLPLTRHSFTLTTIKNTESIMKALKSISLLFAIFLFTPGSFFAQSPYQCSWQKDSYIVGTGAATAAVGLYFYKSASVPAISEINQLSSGTINWFDRSATNHYSETAAATSDVLFGVAAAAPFVLFADQTMRNDWRTITLMYMETWSFIGGTSMLSKGLIARFRPYVYNPNVSLDKKLTSDAKMSFFSNHTTAAFASAVFLSTIYSDYNPHSEWKPYIWGGSLLMASVVGYMRYAAGEHFPTDILVGAVAGSAIGYAIPWMHRSNNENMSITPSVPHADYGFSVQVKF
jgi:membrane-associated phospholipid phosphatase